MVFIAAQCTSSRPFITLYPGVHDSHQPRPRTRSRQHASEIFRASYCSSAGGGFETGSSCIGACMACMFAFAYTSATRLSCCVGANASIEFGIWPGARAAGRLRRRKNQTAAIAPRTSGMPTPNPTPRPTPRLLLSELLSLSLPPVGVVVGDEVVVPVLVVVTEIEVDEILVLSGERLLTTNSTAGIENVWVELLQSHPPYPVQQNVSVPQAVTPFPESGTVHIARLVGFHLRWEVERRQYILRIFAHCVGHVSTSPLIQSCTLHVFCHNVMPSSSSRPQRPLLAQYSPSPQHCAGLPS